MRGAGYRAEVTHEKLKDEYGIGSNNHKSSPMLKMAAVSKPRRVITKQAQLSERSHT